jgi:hypothetical protein
MVRLVLPAIVGLALGACADVSALNNVNRSYAGNAYYLWANGATGDGSATAVVTDADVAVSFSDPSLADDVGSGCSGDLVVAVDMEQWTVESQPCGPPEGELAVTDGDFTTGGNMMTLDFRGQTQAGEDVVYHFDGAEE